MEKAKPIERIFKGRIYGEDNYLDIYPVGYCSRDGYKLYRQEDGSWICPSCGKIIVPNRREF